MYEDLGRADTGELVDVGVVEPLFELSPEAEAYLASHSLADAPADAGAWS